MLFGKRWARDQNFPPPAFPSCILVTFVVEKEINHKGNRTTQIVRFIIFLDLRSPRPFVRMGNLVSCPHSIQNEIQFTFVGLDQTHENFDC